MAESSSIRVPVLYGTGAFGAAPVANSIIKIHEPVEAQKFVDVLVKHGQVGLDTSRIYGNGGSEGLLARLDLKGARVDTKAFPVNPGDHSPAKLRQSLETSLKALAPHKIRVFYLHKPDRSVPFEDTLQTVDELYKEGHFEEFGLSNYPSWEIGEIVGMCKMKGWIRPTAYQCIYNALDRTIESELIPCIRKYGLKLAAYSPLAGGFLAGNYLTEPTENSHFNPKWALGSFYINRYMHMAPALKELQKTIEKHQLTLSEVAIRWLQHHSALGPQDLGIVFGASKPEQFDNTLKNCAKGSLPHDVVAGLDAAYDKGKPDKQRYLF